MRELRSGTITRSMLLDPHIEVLVGLAPKRAFFTFGRQTRGALRVTVVDRFGPNEKLPEPLHVDTRAVTR
jgi:hypothetical protein